MSIQIYRNTLESVVDSESAFIIATTVSIPNSIETSHNFAHMIAYCFITVH